MTGLRALPTRTARLVDSQQRRHGGHEDMAAKEHQDHDHHVAACVQRGRVHRNQPRVGECAAEGATARVTRAWVTHTTGARVARNAWTARKVPPCITLRRATPCSSPHCARAPHLVLVNRQSMKARSPRSMAKMMPPPTRETHTTHARCCMREEGVAAAAWWRWRGVVWRGHRRQRVGTLPLRRTRLKYVAFAASHSRGSNLEPHNVQEHGVSAVHTVLTACVLPASGAGFVPLAGGAAARPSAVVVGAAAGRETATAVSSILVGHGGLARCG